jgi:hypothetical protein
MAENGKSLVHGDALSPPHTHHTPRQRVDMVANIRIFFYLLNHKWHVFRACLALRVPLWQALVHDWSKFRPSEFGTFAQFAFGGAGWRKIDLAKLSYTPGENLPLDMVKNYHQKRNPHHWQYWLYYVGMDDVSFIALPMPERFAREMVADWIGAAKAQKGPNVLDWYERNRDSLVLHPETRAFVETLLRDAQRRRVIP